MNPKHCAIADRDEAAARYVADRLERAEADDYELHLLTCGDCREAVTEAAAVRSALRLRRTRRRAAVLAPVGLATTAGLAWLVLLPGPLERLGHVDTPPSLAAMQVRADVDAAAQHAQDGIEAYSAGDYRQAARSLALAHAERPDPAVAFFLGASLLMTGDADSAVVVLRQVTSAPASPYAAEAHYYAAKAWLQLAQRDSARMHLLRVMAPPAWRARARALLNSINSVR